jgi:choline transport protein
MPNASRNVPIAMVGSIVVNGLMGLAYCIMLLYSTSSLEDLLTTPTGFPFMQIYLSATSSRAGATVMSLMLILIATAATVACVTSTSRTLWAFARDEATPLHKYLSKVDPKNQIPTNAVVVITVLQMILGFIYIGNTQAFNAILAMAIIGLYLSYMLPIICMLFSGRRNLQNQDYGPFKLGRPLGIALNVLSIAWMTIVIIFSTFPTVMPVFPENMNYSIVVMSGWILFGVAYYYFGGGRSKFVVPEVGEVLAAVSMPVEK